MTVLWFAFLLAVVTYLDRVCISAAAPYISDELHLTTVQMGVVLSAFALAYSLFEIPSGWLGDVVRRQRLPRFSQPASNRRSRPPVRGCASHAS